MKDFAVIETGGKQYLVSAGDKVKAEKLPAEAGASLTIDKVLMLCVGDKVQVGAPYVKGAAVSVKLARQFRDVKKTIFKYSPKSRTRRRKGHRQHVSELEVVSIA
jgi:large subunit ribosomal protein L21